ncbi:hypothetical protein THAOC_22532, partial [Thalassiosira oceanica]
MQHPPAGVSVHAATSTSSTTNNTSRPHTRKRPQTSPQLAREERGTKTSSSGGAGLGTNRRRGQRESHGKFTCYGVAAAAPPCRQRMSERMEPVDRPGKEPVEAPAQNDGASVGGADDRPAAEAARYLDRLLNEGHE